MVNRVIVAAIFLGASLLNFPAYADPPPPQAPVVELQTAARPETGPAEAESAEVDKINLQYVKGYATDTARIVASPLHWEARDWMKFGLVVGGTSTLFLIDQQVKNLTQKHQNAVASKFADLGNFIGDPIYIFPSVGAFYLYGCLAENGKARRASLLALESLTISGMFTSGIKTLARRHRPNTGDSSTTWDGPTLTGKNVSFSSGHTSSAFSVATVIAEEYKDIPYVAPVAYGLATLTGLSRIYSNEHWSSDTLFGAALGYFVSKAVLSYHKNDKNKQATRLSVMPEVGKQMTGLTVSYKF